MYAEVLVQNKKSRECVEHRKPMLLRYCNTLASCPIAIGQAQADFKQRTISYLDVPRLGPAEEAQ
jgi:hypothetical protein